MAMTPEQLAEVKRRLLSGEKAPAAPDRAAKAKEQLLAGRRGGTPTTAAAERAKADLSKPTNLFAAGARMLTEPLLRGAATARQAISGVGELGTAGVQYLKGDKAAAAETMRKSGERQRVEGTEGTQMGELGKVKPYFYREAVEDSVFKEVGSFAKETVGAGAEIAPYFIGAGVPGAKAGAKAIGAGKVALAAKEGAKGGALIGGLTGFGKEMARPESSLGEIAAGTAIGTVAGGTIGGALGGISAFAVKGAKAGAKAAETAKGKVGEVTGRGRDVWSRYRLSQDQKKLEAGLADDLMRGGEAPKVTPDVDESLILKAKTAELNPGDVGLIRSATPEEGQVMAKMANLAERNLGQRAPKERPTQMAGDYIIKNVKKLDDFREAAGARLDDAITAMPEKPVDVSKAKSVLENFLKKNGVKVEEVIDEATGEVSKVFDFGKRFKDNAGVQKEIKSIYDDLAEGMLSPQEIVSIRRRLFDLLDLAKDQKDIVGPIEGMLGAVREKLDEPLTALSDDYAQAAQDYAKTRGLLSDWYRKLGMKYVEGTRPTANLRAGEVMGRVLGNNSSEYVDLLERTSSTLGKFGLKSKVDPMVLLRFNAALEDLFGTTQSRSLRGQVGGAIEDVLNPAVDVATGGKSAVFRAGVAQVKKAMGNTKEAQRAVLKELIKAYHGL